jgi:hypothetical protein
MVAREDLWRMMKNGGSADAFRKLETHVVHGEGRRSHDWPEYRFDVDVDVNVDVVVVFVVVVVAS